MITVRLILVQEHRALDNGKKNQERGESQETENRGQTREEEIEREPRARIVVRGRFRDGAPVYAKEEKEFCRQQSHLYAIFSSEQQSNSERRYHKEYNEVKRDKERKTEREIKSEGDRETLANLCSKMRTSFPFN